MAESVVEVWSSDGKVPQRESLPTSRRQASLEQMGETGKMERKTGEAD